MKLPMDRESCTCTTVDLHLNGMRKNLPFYIYFAEVLLVKGPN